MRVQRPNLTQWLAPYIRGEALAAGHTLDVEAKEPAQLRLPLQRPLVVVREDPGSRLNWTTFDCSVGVSVLAGTRLHDLPARELALWLASVLHDDALPLVPGTPIASVEWGGCGGPYGVDEDLDVSRQYLTAQYVVSGSW